MFMLTHTLVSRVVTPTRTDTLDNKVIYNVNLNGKFLVLFPGKLSYDASAFTKIISVDESVGPDSDHGRPPRPRPPQGGVSSPIIFKDLKFQISTPDQRHFTATEVTLADLQRYRDLQGAPQLWSYIYTGESNPIPLDRDNRIYAKGKVEITVRETIKPESAPPLFNKSSIPLHTPTPRSFSFDLYRVGMFVAKIDSVTKWNGSLKLIDPEEKVISQTSPTQTELRYDVKLASLNKSRDAAGRVRNWRLEASSQPGTEGFPHVSAKVISSSTIKTSVLQKRIEFLLGERGEFLEIFGENVGGEALLRLRIKNHGSAETMQIVELLDHVLRQDDQDDGVDLEDVKAGEVYTIYRSSEILRQNFGPLEVADLDFKLDISSVRVGRIDVDIIKREARHGQVFPSVKLTVEVSGTVKIKLNKSGKEVAELNVHGGKFTLDVGIKVSADGRPQLEVDVPKTILVGNVKTDVLIAAGGIGLAKKLNDKLQEKITEINKDVVDGLEKIFSDPALAPRIMMMIHGAAFTYLPIRFEGDRIIFDYYAPIEPEPRPTPGYQGAIGRTVLPSPRPDAVRFAKPMPNTWRIDNFKLGNNAWKIDHIVVVMMENRSYDHVLGYRAQLGDGSDGLSDNLIKQINASHNGQFQIQKMRDTAFPKQGINVTRFPKGVGHDWEDVIEQLSETMNVDIGDGKTTLINSPKGFVENFKSRIGNLQQNPEAEIRPEDSIKPNDVLAYYDQQDFPFFAFLAQNYAFSDTYFCSHPGPTLPNRMFSLTGDVQRDRYGFPIFNNNNLDNFLLSRATTIYDLLERKGQKFRVYESEPSVTMLRMFARYVTDTTNIVSLEQLALDVKPGGKGLPAFTAIEPQMHAWPANDDHSPHADMQQGQIFLKKIYDTLTSNPEIWKKTLLIITYDEHGGFYDHVKPPVADVYNNVLSRDPGRGEPPPVSQKPVTKVQYGLRVPTFVVSPWVNPGQGPSITLDHCSILKTLLVRFFNEEQPFLSDRVEASHSFEPYLTASEPRMNIPKSPDIPVPNNNRRSISEVRGTFFSKPITRKDMRGNATDYHQLSGYVARQVLGRK